MTPDSGRAQTGLVPRFGQFTVLGEETPLWLLVAFVIACAVIAFVAWRSWSALRGSGAWSDEPDKPRESESPFWVPRDRDG